jgi:tripartite-type tricarboxylate transporter receptor subunit TctC
MAVIAGLDLAIHRAKSPMDARVKPAHDDLWGNRMSISLARFLLLLAPCALAVATPAAADPIEDFYRGKQIRMYIRAAPGGNYDVYSRILGRHIARFIPGNPLVVPVNMPGGGGLVALNYVANAAPRDGTVLTMITQSFPMDQALGLDNKLTVDMRSLNWIGNMSNTNEFLYTAKSSATRTLDDARRRETVIAATGIGSIVTQLSAVYNNVLGTKFKVIYGYPSGPEMTLAMERGEVEGRSTSNPQVLAPTKAEVLAKYNFIIQAGPRMIPQFEEVPLLREQARTSDEHAIFDFLSNAIVLARPIVTNAGVPPERVAALRRAFDAALADPAFLEEAERQNLEIGAKSGEELQKIVADLIETPPAVLEQVKRAIQIKGAEPVKGARPGE